MIEAAKLHGISLTEAETMGKPHIGAEYKGGSGYVRTSDVCAICGRPATNVHHIGRRLTFTFVPNDKRAFIMRSALIALCGSGTTGCHGAVHAGRIKIRWKWDSEEASDKWWSGELIHECGQHSEKLYEYGCWQIETPEGTKEIR